MHSSKGSKNLQTVLNWFLSQNANNPKRPGFWTPRALLFSPEWWLETEASLDERSNQALSCRPVLYESTTPVFCKGIYCHSAGSTTFAPWVPQDLYEDSFLRWTVNTSSSISSSSILCVVEKCFGVTPQNKYDARTWCKTEYGCSLIVSCVGWRWFIVLT